MSASISLARREIQIALVLIATALFSIVLESYLLPSLPDTDFVAFYSAGLIVRQGHSSKLYDVQEQTRVEVDLRKKARFMIYAYPPIDAVLFVPLTILTYGKAFLIWGAINVLLWLSFQHLLRPFALAPQSLPRYLVLCSFFFPLWTTLFQGQTALILLVLYSSTFVSLKRDQDFMAGVFLGLGCFKFHLVLPFALICLLRGKWKLMRGFALAGSLLVLLSAVVAGPRGVLAYVNLLMNLAKLPLIPQSQSWGGFEYLRSTPTLKGFFGVLLSGRVAPHWISVLVTAVSAFLILFTAWRWRKEDRRGSSGSLNVMFAAAILVTLLTSLHLYVYDLTLMLLAVLLVVGSPEWSMKSRWRVALNVTIVILYIFPLYLWLLQREAMYLLTPVIAAFAVSSLGLAGKMALQELSGEPRNRDTNAVPGVALTPSKYLAGN
jgi:hypothetical protein